MKRFATPALVLGLVGLAAGGVLREYRPSWSAAWPAALIVGGLLLLFGLYASFPNAREMWGRRTTKYGLNALVMVVLILGVIALVEAVSYRHNWRVDLTENRRHSLSPQTIKVLRELPAPVKATAFFRPDQPGKRTAEDLFKQYTARSDGKFTWEIVDADRDPLRAKRYGVETYGTVVLEATVKAGQVKEEKILDAEEEKLTNGLIRVTREGKRTIYVVKGHGEKDPASSEKTGLSEVKAAVEKLNYEVKDLLLARETKIPDDAAIVVVPGPQKDLLPNEVDALAGYLARAGKVLVMADPFQAPGLTPFLDRYGIVLGNDVVLDDNPQAQLLGFGAGVPVVGDYQDHPITRGFQFATIFPLVRTVNAKDKPPEGVTAQALARTSPQSWVTDEKELKSGQVKRAAPETRKAYPIAAVATLDAKGAPEDRKTAKARVVVIGDSDFATNAFVNLSGNRDFFLNTLSWLAEEENLISIRPKESRNSPVMLTAAQGQVLFWLPVVVLPLTMALAGVAAVARKRGM
jgi:gliding motility-associatede transport system auxiliary component